MKPAAALVAAALAWTACSKADPHQLETILPGLAFSLKPGTSAQTAGASLRVGLDGVVNDSRCPKGVQCFWAGEAVVRIWLQVGAGERQRHELRTTPGPAQVTQAGGQELRLVGVEPYPLSGRPIAPESYLVTLILGAPGKTASEK